MQNAPVIFRRRSLQFLLMAGCAAFAGCRGIEPVPPLRMDVAVITWDTPTDPALQQRLEALDARLRDTFGMNPAQAAAGLLDLRTGRLAMIHPDRIEYAASVAKIAILLAWFELKPGAVARLDPQTRHELGLMAKASSDFMATKYSKELGLHRIQDVLNARGFYDITRGGGLWMGKHYAKGDERRGDPLADHSHAATVRQVIRFFQLLDRGELVSPEASAAMRSLFASPEIPHDGIKFVKALAGRDRLILRKWGTWKDWLHDAALITGPGRRYILVGLTCHPRGDEYLEELAKAADDWMPASAAGR